MPENCTFWIARYVPDAVRGEFLTVGVLLFCGSPPQFVGARWTEDWCLAQLLDPAVNLELLQSMCQEITDGLKNGRDIRELAVQGEEAIQFSGPTACMVPNATTMLDELAAIYLKHNRRPTRVQESLEELLAFVSSVHSIEGAEKDHLEARLQDEIEYLSRIAT